MTNSNDKLIAISLDMLDTVTGGQRLMVNDGPGGDRVIQGAATGLNPKLKNIPSDMAKGCVAGGIVGARRGPVGAAVGCLEGAAGGALSFLF